MQSTALEKTQTQSENMLYNRKLTIGRNTLDFIYRLDGTDSWVLVLELQKCLQKCNMMTQNLTAADINIFF